MIQPIVTDDLRDVAQKVIQTVRRHIRYPFILDAKLGSADNPPMTDTEIAATYQTPATSIGPKWARIIRAMSRADQEHGNPLLQIAERANAAMANASLINRHNRRPPLYAEATLDAFAKMGFAVPEHFPLIRAAGHLTPPPVVPASHSIDSIISDIADHMARSHQPQGIDEILQSLVHQREAIAKWPELDLTIFIDRTAGIQPDDQGNYHPDQDWGNFVTTQRLVASTALRILASNQKALTAAHLVSEIDRLVGRFLPDGYNTLNAVRNFVYNSEEVHRQSLSTFGLKEWYAASDVQNAARPRGRTGDTAHAFLMEHGPAKVEEIIEHVQRVARTTRRTIQDVINHDNSERFIRTPDGRVAANPFHRSEDADTAVLTVVPDGQRRRPGPVLQQSELLWVTHYAQALDGLEPPWPAQATLTGQRAAGFTSDEPMEITVVVDDRDRASLENRLAEIADAASEAVPSIQPQVSILSVEQWAERMDGATPVTHHNVWLAADATP